MLKIIFWQNILSIHQSSLIRNLAENSSYAVTLVVEERVPVQRLAMGWHQPDFGKTELIVAPDESSIKQLIDSHSTDTIHIFSGFRYCPLLKNAFQKAIEAKVTIGMYLESGDWRGLKGYLRLLRSHYDAWRYGQYIDFILAIGHLGVRWYKQSGFSEEKIYPFGYFVESPHTDELDKLQNSFKRDSIQLTFVGSLIHRKGIDVLLKSLAELPHFNWQLNIIGDGPEYKFLQTKGNEFELASKLYFRGTMENTQLMNTFHNSDMLVLSSRWDGWGAVVNEALMRGVPVICTDHCGAADLLRDSWRGTVVKAGSVESLKNALEKWLEQGPASPEKRQRIQHWAEGHISGAEAAQYLQQIIEHVRDNASRPIAPWLR